MVEITYNAILIYLTIGVLVAIPIFASGRMQLEGIPLWVPVIVAITVWPVWVALFFYVLFSRIR